MLTEFGRSYCIKRLRAATSLDELRQTWEQLGVFPQNDAEIKATRVEMEARLGK